MRPLDRLFDVRSIVAQRSERRTRKFDCDPAKSIAVEDPDGVRLVLVDHRIAQLELRIAKD